MAQAPEPVLTGLAGARAGPTGPVTGQTQENPVDSFVELGGSPLPSSSIDTPLYLFG
jgi:hypothetical protein